MCFISKSVTDRQFLLNKSFTYFWLIYQIVKFQIYSSLHSSVVATKMSKCLLSPAGWEIIKCIPCVCVCVTFLERAVHHTGCFSLAFSMFYDLIAYVFSFDAVFSDLGP